MDKAPPPSEDDARRERERQALRDTRALVDDLEREEAGRGKSVASGLVLAGAIVATILAAGIGWKILSAPAPKTAAQTACERRYYEAEMRQSGELLARWRNDPALTPAEVQGKFSEFEKGVLRNAARECAPRG